MQQQEKECENCHKMFPVHKIDLHEAYCRRNIRKCLLCSRMYDINDEAAHQAEFHTNKPCPYCTIKYDQLSFQHHVANCQRKPTQCRFCENLYPFLDVDIHQKTCGSRTKRCEICKKYVKIKDEAQHEVVCKERRQLRRNQSQEANRNVPRNERIIVPERERMKSNEQISKEDVISPRVFPKEVKIKAENIIEAERIQPLIDPVPISIRLAMQKEKNHRPPLNYKN